MPEPAAVATNSVEIAMAIERRVVCEWVYLLVKNTIDSSDKVSVDIDDVPATTAWNVGLHNTAQDNYIYAPGSSARLWEHTFSAVGETKQLTLKLKAGSGGTTVVETKTLTVELSALGRPTLVSVTSLMGGSSTLGISGVDFPIPYSNANCGYILKVRVI